jgi:tRNA(Glu) U13 pseudouridine synthase TruD
MVGMNYSLNPKTFKVKEIFSPKLEECGRYYYYLAERNGMSHSKMCKLIPKDSAFAGIKDKHAAVEQWFSSKQKIENIESKELTVTYKGQGNEKIFIGAHKGNEFKVLVELSEEEQKRIKKFNQKKEFVCNYFGKQRFSEKNVEVAELLEKEEYEEALKVFLCRETKMDSELSKKMRKIISEKWGNWREIAESEELRETKKRKVFDFLEEKQEQKNTSLNELFKEAFLHVEPRSMSIVVKTAQSIRFNRELNKLALEKKKNNLFGELGSAKVALSANKSFKRKIIIEPTEFEKNFRKSALERETFFNAKKLKLKKTPEKNNFWLEFELEKGCYATIFLIFLEKWLEKKD